MPSLVKEIVWTLTDSWRGKAGLVIRYAIAKTSAQSCGGVVYIGPYVEIRNWKYLRFGSNISIQRGCYLDAVGGISIGDNVSVAHGTSILSSNHQWYDPFLPIRDNPLKYEGVDIVGDVWIGCACQIMGGHDKFPCCGCRRCCCGERCAVSYLGWWCTDVILKISRGCWTEGVICS